MLTDKEKQQIANELEDDSAKLKALNKKRKRQEKALQETRKEIWALHHRFYRNKDILNNN